MPDRLLIVSNRLPITTTVDGETITFAQASGGLATGLRGFHEKTGGLWIGWPGTAPGLPEQVETALTGQLKQAGIAPVFLTEQELREYYEDFSNGVLWPVFHYLLERLPLAPSSWSAYRQVNQKFADRVVAEYRPGDVIWIHDYQLLLVPGMVREQLPGARIGFFLHIPFPAAEVFRILPWREAILRSLLAADLVGFHTHAYAEHFAAAVAALPDLEPEEDHVWVGSHLARFGAFAMGIDAARFQALGDSAETARAVDDLRQQAGDRTLLVAVDRLDYTKGIKQRLVAFESLLEQDATLRDRVRLIQVAAPSREEVRSYQDFRRDIEELIGRINGKYGTLSSVPIHYLYQTTPPEQLVPLYRAADVMLVTPLRDGMNLVAKEFIASRTDERGVLVLSEFAGAAEELREAIIVNAHDITSIADGIRLAMAMPAEAQARRLRAMRRRVLTFDVHKWATDFLSALTREGASPSAPALQPLADAIAWLRTAAPLAMLLDYDGTLTAIAATPDLAPPDDELHDLLGQLAMRPATRLFLVSGRSREDLDRWFGDLALDLWAEHGTWWRPAAGREWQAMLDLGDRAWLDISREVMEDFAYRTPGAFVEPKSAAIAWHFRKSESGVGSARARELRVALSRALADQPAEILEGKKVIEVRRRGATKAAVVQHLLASDPTPAAILSLGDDRTDEEMFAALPPNAVTIRVGGGPTIAQYRLRDAKATRALLREFV
jgi:trehalose 6-phosphate synthase/phosphatase